jgi:5-methylcytosine-specific restriction endonuclease McrA
VRIRNPNLLRALHYEWLECAVCGSTGHLSLHHVHKHPRHDVRGNLVMLCGDGVQGCHGAIEAHDQTTSARLGRHLICHRPDTMIYLETQLDPEGAREWLWRQLWVSS